MNIRVKEQTELARQEEELRLKRRYEEEKRIEEMRLKMREQFNKKQAHEKPPVAEGTDVKVKLPKLTITIFKGTSLDWTRFWNQFTAEIDSTKIAGVSKFSYLKELLDPKVKPLIDGLPFTSEGYKRAKNILETKFGKISYYSTCKGNNGSTNNKWIKPFKNKRLLLEIGHICSSSRNYGEAEDN